MFSHLSKFTGDDYLGWLYLYKTFFCSPAMTASPSWCTTTHYNGRPTFMRFFPTGPIHLRPCSHGLSWRAWMPVPGFCRWASKVVKLFYFDFLSLRFYLKLSGRANTWSVAVRKKLSCIKNNCDCLNLQQLNVSGQNFIWILTFCLVHRETRSGPAALWESMTSGGRWSSQCAACRTSWSWRHTQTGWWSLTYTDPQEATRTETRGCSAP